MIQVQNQSIQINGEDVLLFGGELHYFRVPKSEWRNRIIQAKQAGINMISTYVPWGFHEYQEGQIDLEGRTREERDLVSFLQTVKEEGMFCLVRPGPYVMAEVVDHGVPTWFIDQYPEAVAKTKAGETHPTRVVSYLHPTYLEKVKQWYDHVCHIIKPEQIQNGGAVILFQLDNEVGMFHWVTNQGDYNIETKKQFANYLEKKYSLDNFKQTFSTRFDSISQFVSGEFANLEEPDSMAIKNEYSLFMRQYYRNYIEYLKKLAIERGIEVPFVINVHGFDTIDVLKRGKKYPIGLSQLLEVAQIDDVLTAGDYYIGNIEYDTFIDIVLANAFTKSIQSKQQPLFSAEFQGGTIPDRLRLQPSTFDLTTRLCFANGMNAVNYYMFVGGENYEKLGILGRRHEWQAPITMTGKERRHYKVIQHLGKMFQVYESQLAKAKQATDTHLAFYPNYFMTEFTNETTAKMDESLLNARETNIYDGFARGLRLNNIIFDGINIQEEGNLNVHEIPTLWLFADERMDETIQQKLVRYIEDGGMLVMFPRIPTRNMNGEPCTVLQEFIDVEVLDYHDNGFVRIDAIDNVKVEGMEFYNVQTGAFGWSEDDRNATVAFEKTLGNGKLVMFGVSMKDDYDYKGDIYRELASKVEVVSKFDVQAEVDISIRKIEDGGFFVFILNFDEYEKETTIQYQDRLLFEGKEIIVPGRSGLMLPVDIPLRDGLHLVYGSGEILELNKGAEELTLQVKIIQNQEQFVFKSDQWEPKENANIQVSKGKEAGEYNVTITGQKNTVETILFNKKNIM